MHVTLASWHIAVLKINTTLTLTLFGSDISLGTATKCSVNMYELCRTELCWDMLIEPGQHIKAVFDRIAK